MLIGDTLRILRLQRGLTQGKLAQMADMKQSAISRIEKNKGLPSVDKFEPLARALGVSPADFFAAPSKRIAPSLNSEGNNPTEEVQNQTLSTNAGRIENRVIEAYKKLEQGSSQKKAVDILLFAETEKKENSD